jgi:ABC-type multidrug transport system fused ATPase/permease subunit
MSDPETSELPGAATPGSMLSSLRRLLGQKRSSVVGLVITSLLSGLTEAGILAIVAQVGAALVNGVDRMAVEVGPLHLDETVGSMLTIAAALALLRLALQVPVSVLPARISSDVQMHLRETLFDSFTRASWAEQSRDREGHLQELTTNQATEATQGAIKATELIVALATFVVMVASALVLNVVAALIVLVAAVVLFALLRPLNRLGVRFSRALSQAQLEYAGGVGQAARVAQEAQVFGVAAFQRRRIDGLADGARHLFFRRQLLGLLIPNAYQSLVYLILIGGLAVVYATGAGRLGSLGAVILLLVRAGGYGRNIQSAYSALRQRLPYVDRLREAEEHYADSSPRYGTAPLRRVETLAFEEVSFAYVPERPVLHGVDFEIAEGEAIGVVGPSGTGKSTLIQILLGLQTPREGRYLINGSPAEGFTRADWHRLFSYVPQEPRLLHATVTENIRFMREIDADAVERAAKLAGIHDDIVKWSHGYDTVVGPRADAVSGGQQQRICLARALAAQPEVLVLDEPTSALDPHSELLIQESLGTLKHKLTLVIVAHRMSTLQMCERVMVIVDGRLQAFDTAEHLHLSNSYYRSALAVTVGPPAAQVGS